MAKDIVCGMYVEEENAPYKAKRRNTVYYFCSESCYKEFLSPEIELKRLKLFSALSLTVGAIIATLEYIVPFALNLSGNYTLYGLKSYYLLFVLSSLVQFTAGLRFYRGTVDAIKSRQANMDTLIAIGTTAAWLYSSLITFFPSLFPKSQGVFYTESSLIIGFILLGRTMEHIVKGKASESVLQIIELQPEKAMIIRENKILEVPIEQVKLDDIAVVKPGERIPVDGIIIEGNTLVDQSIVTGESMPVEKKAGDEVMAGTINKNSMIKIKTTRTSSESTLSKIVEMVENAIVSQTPSQRIADKVASIFVPIVVLIAVFSFTFWYFVYGNGFSVSFTTLISVLIIACPCALGIATPAAIMIGASKGAQNGILIKNGEALEKARKVTTVVFDKTGTLTSGKPSVSVIYPFGCDENELIMYASIAEIGSTHPIAEAILEEAKKRNINVKYPTKLEETSGKGIVAKYDSNEIVVGKPVFLAEMGIKKEERDGIIDNIESEGKTAIEVAVNGKLIGVIAVGDKIKQEAKQAIKKLNDMNIEVIMLTGDSKRAAESIARQLGISKVYSEVMPNEKAKVIEELKKEGKVVAMVGDGINDAPALAVSDLGIAIGSGTDIAKQTGGIVLLNSNVNDVYKAILLSKKVVKKIKENLFWAFAYNVVLIPVAAGLLYIPFGLLLNPIFAAIAMAASSVTVTLNSMMLRNLKI